MSSIAETSTITQTEVITRRIVAELEAASIPTSRVALTCRVPRAEMGRRLAGSGRLDLNDLEHILRIVGSEAQARIFAPIAATGKPSTALAETIIASWPKCAKGVIRCPQKYLQVEATDGTRWISVRGLQDYLAATLGRDLSVVATIEKLVAPMSLRLGKYFTLNTGHKTDEFDDYFFPEGTAVRVVSAVLAGFAAVDELVLT